MAITMRKAQRLYVGLAVLFLLGWGLTAYADSGQDLVHAAEEGDTSKVKKLLANGADVNAKQKDGVTPLMQAAWKGQTEIAEMLLAKGADVNAKDKNGMTALIRAAYFGHGETVQALLANGANVNVKEHQIGWTALMWAAGKGHPEIVRSLLANGADVNAHDEQNLTPIQIAEVNGHDEIVTLLRRYAKKEVHSDEEKTPDGTGAEEYIPVPAEYNFMMKRVYYTTDTKGRPTGGKIGELVCNGHSISLKSHAFENGFIATEKFGKIKVQVSHNVFGGGFSLYMTKSQLSNLQDVLHGEREIAADSSPVDYDPIEAETETLQVPSQYDEIQDAIDAAEDGATIVVSPGSYEENISISNKSIKLTSENPADDETVASTIIDGKKEDTVIVLMDSNSEILGFTIRAGSSSNQGGGVRVKGDSSPIIKGNTIENNQTASPGGGILLLEANKPRIINNDIRQNRAEGGGGVYAISTKMFMKGNQVTGNTAEKAGGGIWVQECESTIVNNIIEENEANAGGGIYISKNANVTLKDNKLLENDAVAAGGVFIIDHCEVEISDNSFVGNDASQGAGAFAVGMRSSCNLVGNTFEKNKAPEAGVGLVQGASITKADNIFAGNKPDNRIIEQNR